MEAIFILKCLLNLSASSLLNSWLGKIEAFFTLRNLSTKLNSWSWLASSTFFLKYLVLAASMCLVYSVHIIWYICLWTVRLVFTYFLSSRLCSHLSSLNSSLNQGACGLKIISLDCNGACLLRREHRISLYTDESWCQDHFQQCYWVTSWRCPHWIVRCQHSEVYDYRRLHLPVNTRNNNMFCHAVKLQRFDSQLVKAYRLYSIHATFYLTKERRGTIEIKLNRKELSEMDKKPTTFTIWTAKFEV